MNSIAYLSAGAATTHRLASPESLRSFCRLFDGIDERLLPTHYMDNRIPFRLESAGIDAASVWHSHEGSEVELLYEGAVRGQLSLFTRRSPHVTSNWIRLELDYQALISLKLEAHFMRLFDRIIGYSRPAFGYVTARSDLIGYEWIEGHESKKPAVLANGHPIPSAAAPKLTLQYLPWPCWVTVLGRKYVELLGRSELRRAGGHRIRDLDSDSVWIQLSDRPETMFTDGARSIADRIARGSRVPTAFFRLPRTQEELVLGIKDYVTPRFDRTEIGATP